MGRGQSLWLWACGGLVLVFLIAPVLVIIPLSFSDGAFLSFPVPGVSLRWYRAFFASPFWLRSLGNSLLIGAAATALAIAFGLPAAIGLDRLRGRVRAIGFAIIAAPLVVPAIVTAVALLHAFAPLGLVDTYAGLIVAHATLGVPFLVITTLASLAKFDHALMRAAAASGAAPWTAFSRVMLPLILPGILSGAVFAFATSLDESVVVLFLAGPDQRTLPRQMFAGLHDTIELTILAAATIMVVLSTGLLGLVMWLRGRAR